MKYFYLSKSSKVVKVNSTLSDESSFKFNVFRYSSRVCCSDATLTWS